MAPTLAQLLRPEEMAALGDWQNKEADAAASPLMPDQLNGKVLTAPRIPDR